MIVSDAYQVIGATEEREKGLAHAVDAARQCVLPKNVYSLLGVADIFEQRGEPEKALSLVEEGFNLAITGKDASMRDALRAVAIYCIGKGRHELGFRALAHLDDEDSLLLCFSEFPIMPPLSSDRGLDSNPLKEAIRILSWDRDEWARVFNIVSQSSVVIRLSECH